MSGEAKVLCCIAAYGAIGWQGAGRQDMKHINTIYLLINKERKTRDLDAQTLAAFLGDCGYRAYTSAEDAERSLENCEEVLGNPRDFRVVGFRVKPFIPKKPKKPVSKTKAKKGKAK